MASRTWSAGRKVAILGALTVSALSPRDSSAGDEPKRKPPASAAKRFESVEALNAAYGKEFRELGRRQIRDLTALASRQAATKAETTYRQIFDLAMARDQYEAAEQAAEAYLASEREGPGLKAMATLVDAIAKADRKEDDKALEGIERFLKTQQSGDKSQTLPPETIYTVGEAFLQRLIRAGRYDTAKKACDLILRGDPDKNVKDHFAGRLARLKLLNKPAPAISGVDLDGKSIALEQFRGKVVLVDFWATWCPPCVAAVPVHQALLKKYGEEGFAILGVNVDASRHDVKGDWNKVKPTVKRFVEQFRVNWPSVYNGVGARDFAKAYGVGNLPANFLVGRDGSIVEVDRFGGNLDQAIAEALGREKEVKSP